MLRVTDDPFPRLSFELKHNEAVPLSAFTHALERMNARYARFARGAGGSDDGKLYIAEIRKGSIIVDLVATGAAATAGFGALAQGLDTANTLWDFAKNTVEVIKFFKHEAPRPAGLTVTDCDDVRAIVGPAAQVEGGGLSISGNNVTIGTLIQLTRTEAMEIDNRAATEAAHMREADEAISREVLFVWNQVRDAPAVEQGRASPDRGIISSLGPKALPVTFADPDAKASMTRGDFNPFERAFIIDVKTMIGPKGPTGYRVLKLHDVQPLD